MAPVRCARANAPRDGPTKSDPPNRAGIFFRLETVHEARPGMSRGPLESAWGGLDAVRFAC